MTWPRGHNFFMLNSTIQLSSKFQLLINKKNYRQMEKFLGLSLSDVVFIMLINVKMPIIVGILTFMSRKNFVISRVKHEKSFITSGHGCCTGRYETSLDEQVVLLP